MSCVPTRLAEFDPTHPVLTCSECEVEWQRAGRSGPAPTMCPECRRRAMRSYHADYRSTNREGLRVSIRDAYLKRHYGITQSDFDALARAQGDTCAICRRSDPTGAGTWHVDHCHATGAVRGLLCSKCNQAIGLLDDDVDRLANAINYLKGGAA